MFSVPCGEEGREAGGVVGRRAAGREEGVREEEGQVERWEGRVQDGRDIAGRHGGWGEGMEGGLGREAAISVPLTKRSCSFRGFGSPSASSAWSQAMPGVLVAPKGQRSTHFSLADIASAHGVPESVFADRVSTLAFSNDLVPLVDFP